MQIPPWLKKECFWQDSSCGQKLSLFLGMGRSANLQQSADPDTGWQDHWREGKVFTISLLGCEPKDQVTAPALSSQRLWD